MSQDFFLALPHSIAGLVCHIVIAEQMENPVNDEQVQLVCQCPIGMARVEPGLIHRDDQIAEIGGIKGKGQDIGRPVDPMIFTIQLSNPGVIDKDDRNMAVGVFELERIARRAPDALDGNAAAGARLDAHVNLDVRTWGRVL